ncbi:hypothetical protein BGZ67_008497 [Mortierella alpina]|nr:hypothetical protein BGZ67_008497 [Mortierella alpina]
MQESITGVIDLSSQYSLEAFCELMAYIYYNKRYSGSYLRLLFEVLCIADYYDVNAYSTYIDDRIIKLITDVPMCLMIATEARKHGALTTNIYSRCLEFLLEALKPRKAVCYDVNSGDSKAWCCASHSEKCKRHVDPKDSTPYTGLVASAFTPALITINQRPDVIVDDLISAEMKEKEQENKTSSLITSSQ